MTLYVTCSEELETRSRGVDPRWLRAVPLSWQEEIMGVDPELRLAWSHRTGMWGLLRRCDGIKQEFEDGQLQGWVIVRWFPSSDRPHDMKEKISGMVDGHALGGPEKALAALKKTERDAYEKMREEMRQRDQEKIAEFEKNETAIVNDYVREENEKKASRSRAHAKYKLQIAARKPGSK